MKVKLVYKDKNLQIVNVQEYYLKDYCNLLSKRVLSLLYSIESYSEGDLEFRELRHKIFDLAGDIARLSDNILDESISEKIKMKTPPKGFFNFLKKE